MSRRRGNGMFNWFRRCAPCFNPKEGDSSTTVRDEERSSSIIINPLTQDHSFAAARAENRHMPASCVSGVDIKDEAIFICICDSHGSSYQCAAFVQARMTRTIMEEARSIFSISDDALRAAFLRIVDEWQSVVGKRFARHRISAAAGTSCLVGVIVGGNVFIANAGDSRCIIATIDEQNRIIPHQLTTDDNINDPIVRATVLTEHLEERDFLVEDSDGTYHIKGRSQLSKSLGDLYLKSGDFNIDEVPSYGLNSHLPRAAVSADPNTIIRAIDAQDHFIIFASKQLWDILNHQQAVDIVQINPRKGIADTLIRHALANVAERHSMTYRELQQSSVTYHKDIAVAIVFFNKDGAVLGGDVGSFNTEVGTNYFPALEDFSTDNEGLDLEDEDLTGAA